MESKTVIYTPDSGAAGSGAGMLGLLAPLLQKSGLDPNLLLTMNRNNGGFGGEGGWFIWVIFLFFLMGWGNGGWGNGFGGNGSNGLPNLINNDAGRELLMQAIQGSGNAISQLATNLNCSVGQIQQSINGVMTQLQSVGNQVGMSGQQIINAIQTGDWNIAKQLLECCCENRLATCNQTNTLTNTMNTNTQNLKDATLAQTQAILAKLDAAETRVLQDKIDAERAKNAALTTQLSQEHQNAYFAQVTTQSIAPVNNALADLSARIAKIECNQPEVAKVPYSPVVGVPTCVAAQYGLYGGFNPYGVGNGFWG